MTYNRRMQPTAAAASGRHLPTSEALMDVRHVPVLADAIKAYYQDTKELFELCALVDLDLDLSGPDIDFSYVKFSRFLIMQIEYDNRRRFLETIIPSLLNRALERAAHSQWDAQEFHRKMVGNLEQIALALQEGGLPEQVTVPENKPFTAKSEIRDLLGAAETAVTIVDNYVGIGTLDCLCGVEHPIRLLAGQHPNSIAKGFNSSLRDFLAEGRLIEVRQHPKLHDRFILFNGRCWLMGSSLKDAGKKIMNIIECVDIKDKVASEIENKWMEASRYVL